MAHPSLKGQDWFRLRLRAARCPFSCGRARPSGPDRRSSIDLCVIRSRARTRESVNFKSPGLAGFWCPSWRSTTAVLRRSIAASPTLAFGQDRAGPSRTEQDRARRSRRSAAGRNEPAGPGRRRRRRCAPRCCIADRLGGRPLAPVTSEKPRPGFAAGLPDADAGRLRGSIGICNSACGSETTQRPRDGEQVVGVTVNACRPGLNLANHSARLGVRHARALPSARRPTPGVGASAPGAAPHPQRASLR